MTAVNPLVVDLSHHNTISSFDSVYASGIRGVIHKASQGRSYKDPTYAGRRKQAVASRLLWGAYHFGTGDAVASQVDNFLRSANPDDSTLMALDFEDNKDSNMSAGSCVDFLQLLGHKLGRKPIIYGGNRIREQIPKLGRAEQEFVASHPLWLCQYGPNAKVPPPWKDFFLWQFTGDGVGPRPHSIPGIVGSGIDINSYGGSPSQLAMEWAPHVQPPDVQPVQKPVPPASWLEKLLSIFKRT